MEMAILLSIPHFWKLFDGLGRGFQAMSPYRLQG